MAELTDARKAVDSRQKVLDRVTSFQCATRAWTH